MKTSSIAVKTSRSSTQSDSGSIVRQTNKRSSCLRSLLYGYAYTLLSEPWRIGMNETVYQKAFKTQRFYSAQKIYIARKSKNFQRNCLFSFSFKSFQLIESNVLSHLLYFRFASRALTSLIMPVGITGKSGPEYCMANHSARSIFTSSSNIIMSYNARRCTSLSVNVLT